MYDINDPQDPMTAALRGFGEATGQLLMQWVRTLPPEQMLAIDALIGKGAQLGVRFLAATKTRHPTLCVLLADPAGDFHVVAETVFERGSKLQ